MLCVPTLRVEIENVATPLPFVVEEPSMVVPSKNVTVPAGMADVFAVTVAVRVID
jgi:hypothetical protein